MPNKDNTAENPQRRSIAGYAIVAVLFFILGCCLLSLFVPGRRTSVDEPAVQMRVKPIEFKTSNQ